MKCLSGRKDVDPSAQVAGDRTQNTPRARSQLSHTTRPGSSCWLRRYSLRQEANLGSSVRSPAFVQYIRLNQVLSSRHA
jgi:hypothetical protein